MTNADFLRRSEPAGPPPAFEVRKTFWGYVVRGTGGPPMMLQVAQGVVLAFGAAFTAGALLLVLGQDSDGAGLDAMTSGLTVVLSSLALLLIWFATRGGVVELQLDLARGELRELIRHRVGRSTVLGRHGIDAGATLMIDRSGSLDNCALMLRLRDGDAICIARGPEPALLELRRRLDQMLRQRAVAVPDRDRLTA